MRIVAGALKGRAIATPAGRDTRPTSDRAREAIFNLLTHAEWAPDLYGARVIDLFAGSGALGLEALSRGAAFCLFVEQASAARGAIRANLEAFGLFGASRVHRRSATDLGARPGGPSERFDFAFLDPPYGQGLVAPALHSLIDGDWLSPEAAVIVEFGVDEAPIAWPAPLTPIDLREYGAAQVAFLTIRRNT